MSSFVLFIHISGLYSLPASVPSTCKSRLPFSSFLPSHLNSSFAISLIGVAKLNFLTPTYFAAVVFPDFINPANPMIVGFLFFLTFPLITHRFLIFFKMDIPLMPLRPPLPLAVRPANVFHPVHRPLNLDSEANSNSSYHRSEERRVGKECRSRWAPY